jgi:hypothetical protein
VSIDVQLPDGSVARFPVGTSDAEIEDVLRAQVPQIVYVETVDRYAVRRAGVAFGYRRTLAEATELANSLPPPPVPPRPSAPAPPPQRERDAFAVDLHEASRIDRAIRRQRADARRERMAWRKAERMRGRP